MGNAVRAFWVLLIVLAAGGAVWAEESAVAAAPGDFQEARVVPDTRVPLRVPPGALQPGEESVFTFTAHVLADGSVSSVTAPTGTAKSISQAAKSAIGKWRYEPATSAGAPIESDVQVSIRLRAPMTAFGTGGRELLAFGNVPGVQDRAAAASQNQPLMDRSTRGPRTVQRPSCTEGSGKNCLIDKRNSPPIDGRLIDLPQSNSGAAARAR